MKLLTLLKLTAALTLALSALSVVGPSPGSTKVLAHEEKSEAAKSAVYSYTAQPRDSYTKMARKAVQTYGIVNKVNLSQAGIVFAETNLTLAAGSPELAEGQKVELKVEDVHQWVDKAQNLSDAKEKAWSAYVRFVNFNTNNVGE